MHTRSFALDNNQQTQVLAWLQQQRHALYLTSNGQVGWGMGRLLWLIAVGDASATDWASCVAQADVATFGLLPYDLKNVLEPSLHTQVPAMVRWPQVALCRATAWLWVYADAPHTIHVQTADPVALWQTINTTPLVAPGHANAPQFVAHSSEAQYLANIAALQAHIVEGDVYEVNLAQTFSAHVEWEQPFGIWQRLNAASPMPMAGYFRFDDLYLLCASPERFVHIIDNTVSTQPIKGTTHRSVDATEDETLRLALQQNPKERAENVMIVDLARNDLNRVCVPGTVEVPELFGTRSYTHLHHLVSTITGQLALRKNWCDVVQAAFPPGSMTGAPKISAMQLIDCYEGQGRGAYAGSLGYVHPELGVDFNVVIRSVVYDARHQMASYHVGGAITYDSDPQAEYAESLLKASGIRQVFG